MIIRITKKKKQDDINFIDINANVSKSFTDLWQRYSPTAWGECTMNMPNIQQE